MLKIRSYVFPKLIFVFFSIIFILFALQVLYTIWGANLVSDEIQGVAASNVIYLKNSFEADIENISLQLEYLMHLDALTRLMVLQKDQAPADYYQSVSDIQDILRITSYSNSILSRMVLYYPMLHVFVSSDTDAGYGNVDLESLNKRIDQLDRNASLLMWSDDHPYVGWYSYSKMNNNTPIYYLEAFLDLDQIKEMLSAYSQYSQNNACLYLHSSQTLLLSENFSSDCDTAFLHDVQPYPSGEVFVLKDQTRNYIAVGCYSALLDCTFLQFIPYQILNAIPHQFYFFILMLALCTLVVAMIYIITTKRIVHRPISILIEAFSKVASGHFDTQVDGNMKSQEYNLLADHFNRMVIQLKSLITENYEMTISLQREELKQLQMQIEPHFLYNSYYQLSHLLQRSDAESRKTAIRMSNYMGRYFQYITQSTKNVISLAEEFNHAATYLSIQKIRFDDYLIFDVAPLPPYGAEVIVPRLILQPLLENAFKYGMRTKDDVFRISVRLRDDADTLVVSVEDNGIVRQDTIDNLNNTLASQVQTDHALANINKRLRLFFGEGYGLHAERSDLGGLSIEILIKKQKKED